MKTIKNMNQLVKVSIASMVLLITVTLFSAKAVSDNNELINRNEIQAASNRLELLTLKLEKAIKFNAPVVQESEADLFELEAAECRLESIVASFEKTIKYISPAVSETTEESDLADTVASLDQINCQIEQLIKYTVPSDVE